MPHGRKGSTAAKQSGSPEMPVKRPSANTRSGRVFAQARKAAKAFRVGLYTRISKHDQRTIPLQIRAPRGSMPSAGAGSSPCWSARSVRALGHGNSVGESSRLVAVLSESGSLLRSAEEDRSPGPESPYLELAAIAKLPLESASSSGSGLVLRV